MRLGHLSHLMSIIRCNFAYDKNGNLVYVNTNRVMTDGHRDNSVGERKLIWDEENRLLAVDDNGFVSNYWYDADGERTVKTSGESDQVYVNGVFSGGSTNTAKFSLYVSPYLVANQGGRYTKHIYAGSQRIVSKVGDFASYGSDPRRIEYAGANTDGLSVDYKSKYAAQQQVIKDNYKFFDVPYNGTDNDNYADGEGFCCNDGSMEAAVAQARKAQTRAVSRSFKDPDNYENLQFFYHPDHLGSSSFITNLDGEVVQHIEYVPFGEVFIEERNNVWNTPYLFNAKEFDEETGMYYYGARYYDPRLSLWMSTDPVEDKNITLSSYAFCGNNPINVTDFVGLDSIQRSLAVERALQYQQKNPGNSYKLGGQGAPGHPVDCSGMVRNCIMYGEEGDPFVGVTGNGVTRIASNSVKVSDMNDVQVGNVVTLDNSPSGTSKPMGHIGIITELKTDENGNTIGFRIVDSGGQPSSGKSGPRFTDITLNGKRYWDKRVTGVYKWDKRPDVVYIQLQEVVVYGKRTTPIMKQNILEPIINLPIAPIKININTK